MPDDSSVMSRKFSDRRIVSSVCNQGAPSSGRDTSKATLRETHPVRRHDHGPDRVVVVKKETHAHVGGRIDHRERRYREVDYRDHRLKEPPRGYHYVRDGNTGEIVLAAIVGGLITALILN